MFDRQRGDIMKGRLREAIWIKRSGTTINQDEEAVFLPKVWNTVVATVPPSGTTSQHS